MKTKYFNYLKEAVERNELFKVNQIFEDEFNVCSNRLDHVDIGDNKITFHDRGMQVDGGVIDCTFSIEPL